MKDRQFEIYMQEWDISKSHKTKWESARRQWGLVKTLIEKQRPMRNGMKLLDVGCGSGWLAILATENNLDAYGIDINKGAIEYAKKTAEKRRVTVKFKVANIEQLPYPDNYFDIVCAVSILEHVLKWEKAIDEMHRVLKPGGILYISTTNRFYPISAECPSVPFYPWLPYKTRYSIQKRRFGDQVDNFMDYHMFTFIELKGKLESKSMYAKDLITLLQPNDLIRMVGRRNPRLRLIGSKLLGPARLPVLHSLAYLFIPAIFLIGVKNFKSINST